MSPLIERQFRDGNTPLWRAKGWPDKNVHTDPVIPSGNGPTATASNTGIPAGTNLVTSSWAWQNVSGTAQSPILVENKDFSSIGSDIYIYGSYLKFKNCKWPNTDIIVQDNHHVTFERCEAWKFSVSSAQDIQFLNIKSQPKAGKDAMSIASDSRGRTERILIDGFYAVGHRGNQVDGSGNHYDHLQIRGASEVTINNAVFDGADGIHTGLKPPFYPGTQGAWDALSTQQKREQYFTTVFNASIYFENALGGNSNITVSNCFLRGVGYATIMLFTYSGYVRFINNVFGKPPPQTDYLRNDSVTPSIGTSGNVWAEFYTPGSLAGTPLTLTPGVGP